jgi:chromosome segregation ATPase
MTGDTLWAAFVGAIVAGLASLITWFLFRRPIETYIKKTDDLETKLTDLQDRRVAKIEESFEKCAKAEGEKRKTIYERLEELEKQSVTVGHLTGELEKFTARLEGCVTDVNRASDRIRETAKNVDRIAEKQIALGEDLANLQGQLGGRR